MASRANDPSAIGREVGEGIFAATEPEVALPLEFGKQLAPHVPTFLMVPLVVLSIIFVIVGIIVLAADKDKTPGALITLLGFLLGGGAFFVMVKTEGKKKQA